MPFRRIAARPLRGFALAVGRRHDKPPGSLQRTMRTQQLSVERKRRPPLIAGARSQAARLSAAGRRDPDIELTVGTGTEGDGLAIRRPDRIALGGPSLRRWNEAFRILAVRTHRPDRVVPGDGDPFAVR